MDAHEDQTPEPPRYRSPYTPASDPIIKPGESLSLSELLDRLPPPNPGFLRDIELAQSEDLLRDAE